MAVDSKQGGFEMKSLTQLFKIGPGPSSSHTFGPQQACKYFKEAYPQADKIEVTLYGSLSLTGKGHLTDWICHKELEPIESQVHFSKETCEKHPNTMDLTAYQKGKYLGQWRVYSIGGGAIQIEGKELKEESEVYLENSFQEIHDYCLKKQLTLDEYVDEIENLDDYMDKICDQMILTVEEGLNAEGVLPGKLKLKRAAKELYAAALKEENTDKKRKMIIMAYAYGASEVNASGGLVVTAPTMGASGVLPALVRYHLVDLNVDRQQVIKALKVAALIGNLFKTNATISGAQGGCQAEIGVACAMGSAFTAYLNNCDIDKIAYAAEVGIEHFLGLTCDPVGGYVMIPCIERNAVAALRAMDAALLADVVGSIKENRVSLDMVIHTMNYTGKKIAVELKETSLGGLATVVPMKE